MIILNKCKKILTHYLYINLEIGLINLEIRLIYLKICLINHHNFFYNLILL